MEKIDTIPPLRYPRVVFFSGGTSLQNVSFKLGEAYALLNPSIRTRVPQQALEDAEYLALSSFHILTCFDSGGSSAILRRTFSQLPAVGDIRNRLCSLSYGLQSAVDHFDDGGRDLLWFKSNLTTFMHTRLPRSEQGSLSSSEIGVCLSQIVCTLANPDSPVPMEALSSQQQQLLTSLIQLTRKTDHRCQAICSIYLNEFISKSLNFDLHGASIGNLVTTGAYLHNGDNFPQAIQDMGDLLGLSECMRDEFMKNVPLVHQVIPSSVLPLTLAAQLESGVILRGQHTITTEKGSLQPLSSPISRVFLIECTQDVLDNSPHSHSFPPLTPPPLTPPPPPDHTRAEHDGDAGVCLPSPPERSAPATPSAISVISTADIICYPVGSFYTSIIASLLPRGLSAAIRQSPARIRVFVPNMIFDAEMTGLSLFTAVMRLIDALADTDTDTGPGEVNNSPSKRFHRHYVSHVLLDCSSSYSHLGSPADLARSKSDIKDQLGIEIIEEDICQRDNGKYSLHPSKFLGVLKSLYRAAHYAGSLLNKEL
jgi:2-phospho-L-lactate transferase/gluconeogenesis factor (CofD/UPF0052 family)